MADLMKAAEERKRREAEAKAAAAEQSREEAIEKESATPITVTPVTVTPAVKTPVTVTPVNDRGHRVSLTGDVTVTPVRKTPVSMTPVTQTGVIEIPVDERIWLNNPAVLNWVLDEFLPTLDHNAQAVMLRVLRLTLGFRRRNCIVAIGTLARKTRLSEPTVTRTVRALRDEGYVVTQSVIGGSHHARGLEFRLTEKSLPPEGVAEKTPVRQTPVTVTGVTAIDMKNMKKKKEREAPVAVAPAPDLSVYDVRKIAARFRELHHGESDYTKDRLHADVRTALIGEGREPDDRLIEEAIGA
jgi:hypothetical protein